MSFITHLGLLALVAVPTAAFWRLPCTSPLVVERADPIVQPGMVSGHVHQILGGNGFDFSMTYNDTQASTCTSCTVRGDFSNYWTPVLYYQHHNGSFEKVNQNGGALIYYLQRGGPNNDQLQAFPEGFRMISGDPFKRSGGTDFASQAISYACLNYNGPALPETPNFPNYNCPDGLRSQVFFPSCWDGKNLDSPDHKSHMSFPIGAYNDGSCPDTHPVHLVSIFYEVIWDTNDFADMWYGSEQPFVWSMGDPTGYGFHGDFLNGWNVELLQNAVDTCTDLSGEVQDCPVFQLYPDSTSEGCVVADRIDEPIQGPFDALPGCNPIQPGPAEAQIITNCSVKSTIGAGQAFYTDLTSEGWSYQGCGQDNYYSRALTGASTSGPNMTNEYCVDFCASEGYSVAGSEYTDQCFCGNSIPAVAQPAPGVIGQCTMPCAGDASQNCGGYGLMSLYTKCTSSPCKNSPDLPSADGMTSPNIASGAAIPSDTTHRPVPSSASSSLATATAAAASPSTAASQQRESSTGNTNAIANNAAVSSSNPSSTSSSQTNVAAARTSGSTSASSASPASPSTYSLPNGWTYLSCYVDTLNPRTLPHLAPYTLNGSPVQSTACVSYCSTNGYGYAGTEYGGECWCGNSIADASMADPSTCHMPCDGNSAQICGGSAALTLFANSTVTKRDGGDVDGTERDVVRRKRHNVHMESHLMKKRNYVRSGAVIGHKAGQ